MVAGGRLLSVLVCIAAFSTSCVSPPAKTTVSHPAPVPVEKQPEKPAAVPDAAPVTQPAREFVASEELYRTTFREVQDVVAAITGIIAADDYDGWLSYLTADYIASRSNPEFLADVSNAAVLKKNGIVLKSLRDYFNNVVVRSHLQATLDDIQFIDETHVKAVALVQDTPVILYYLVHENGRWKIGLKQAGES